VKPFLKARHAFRKGPRMGGKVGLPVETVNLPRPGKPDPDTVPVEPARGEFHPGQVIEIEPALGGRSQKAGWRRLDESQVIRGELGITGGCRFCHGHGFQLMVTMSP
jgi:hypothetical protein